MLKDDFPYSRIQLKEIYRSLKKNIIPVKYAYFGIGAKRYNIVISHKDYGITRIENKLLANRTVNIFQDLCKPSFVNLVDIGCGDGKKAEELISYFKKFSSIKYFPVDISNQMLKNAVENVRKYQDFKDVPIHPIECDIEDNANKGFSEIRNIKTGKYNNNLLILLGGTLGNVMSPNEVLSNIYNSMDNGDYLLIGVELWDQNNLLQLKEHYDFPAMYDLVFTTLEYFGVSQDYGSFNVVVDHDSHDIKIMFEFKKYWKYTYPWNEHFKTFSISFKPGMSVQLASSHRFTLRNLKKLTKKIGFNNSNAPYEYSENQYIILMYRK